MCRSYLTLVLTDMKNAENENECTFGQSFHRAQLCFRIGIKELEPIDNKL